MNYEEGGIAMKRKVFLIFALCTSVVFLSAPWSPEARAQAPWRPDKPLEIITSSAAGGSNDQIARVMQRIMQEGKLVPVAVMVMNKPGGNQTIAPTYLNMHAGDPNYLLLANPTLIGNHIAGLTPINYTDVTPVALLLLEHTVFSVRTDAPFKNMRELFEKLKANPTALSIGTVALGGPNHLALAQAAKVSGVDPKKLKTVVFKTNAESMTALAGGPHPACGLVDQLGPGPGEGGQCTPPRRRRGSPPDGRIRVRPHPAASRASTRASRAGAACSGPKASPVRRQPTGKRIMARMAATPDWKTNLERHDWSGQFLRAAEFAKYLEADYAANRAVMSDLGLTKK